MDDRSTSLPTDHEVRQSLSAAQLQIDRDTAELEARYANVVFDEEDARAELDAYLEDPIEGRTPEAQERNRKKAHSKKYVQAQLSPMVLKIWLMAGLVAVFAGLFGGPAIEFSMFFRAFSDQFADQFGELSAAGRADATLFSLQAVGLVIAFKIWAVKAGRMELLIGAAFLAAIGFLVGAIIKHANAQIERAAMNANSEISWNTLPGDTVSNVTLFGTEISAYLLSLGFFVVPIVSAALISWGWSQTVNALSGLHKAKLYRRDNRAEKRARRARPKIERAMDRQKQEEEAVVTADVNDLVAEHIENARYETARISKARSQKHNIPSDRLDADEAAARAQIDKLGNGFVKDAFAKWQADQRGSPP